jgi:hypothetical protein
LKINARIQVSQDISIQIGVGRKQSTPFQMSSARESGIGGLGARSDNRC